MKTQTVTVGAKEVTVTISTSLHPLPVVWLEAKCDKVSLKKPVSLNPKHDQTAEQFQKDVARAVQQIAEEAAGHARSHELLASLDSDAPAA